MKPATVPQIVKTDYISQLAGIDASILSYSNTVTGTHKLYKAFRTVNDAKRKGAETILFINPFVEERKDSNGSGIDALELACALYYPSAQVVSVVHDSRALWKEPINKDFPDSRQRISMGLDLNKFYDSRSLKEHFKSLMQSKEGDEDVRAVRDFLYNQGNPFIKKNPLRIIDGTNLGNIGDYGLSEEIVERSRVFDYIVGSAGAGGRALDQITNLGGEKTKHIITVPNGHPLDPFHNYEESTSPRVQTKFRGNTHIVLNEVAQGRDDVIFKSVGFFGGKKAKEVIFDPAIKQDNLDLKSSSDGCLGLSVLREVTHPDYKSNLKKGIRIFNTHKATKKGFQYLYNTTIPKDSKVLFVDTGVSTNLRLNELVELGVVK